MAALMRCIYLGRFEAKVYTEIPTRPTHTQGYTEARAEITSHESARTYLSQHKVQQNL